MPHESTGVKAFSIYSFAKLRFEAFRVTTNARSDQPLRLDHNSYFMKGLDVVQFNPGPPNILYNFTANFLWIPIILYDLIAFKFYFAFS